MAANRRQWLCPGCQRVFQIPEASSDPDLCPECRRAARKDDDDDLGLPTPPPTPPKLPVAAAETTEAPMVGGLDFDLLRWGRSVAKVMAISSVVGFVISLLRLPSQTAQDSLIVWAAIAAAEISSFGFWVVVLAAVHSEGHLRAMRQTELDARSP